MQFIMYFLLLCPFILTLLMFGLNIFNFFGYPEILSAQKIILSASLVYCVLSLGQIFPECLETRKHENVLGLMAHLFLNS